MINLMKILGCIGVPVFFLISGYAFSFNNKKLATLFKDKLTKIIIPWFITGLFIQLYYLVINNNNISILKLFGKSLFGNAGSYYLAMLLIYYMIFYYIKGRSGLYIIILSSIISQLLTSFGLITDINPYYNPLNWIIYFSLGYQIGNKNCINRIYTVCKQNLLVIILLFASITVVCMNNDYIIGYWSTFYILYAIIGMALLIGLAYLITNKYKENIFVRILTSIGHNSFFIYLINFPIATAITKLLVLAKLWRVVFLAPFITIMIIIIVINTLKRIASDNIILQKIILYIGIR